MWTLTVAWQQYELSQYIHEHKHIRILIRSDRQIDREKDIRACRHIHTDNSCDAVNRACYWNNAAKRSVCSHVTLHFIRISIHFNVCIQSRNFIGKTKTCFALCALDWLSFILNICIGLATRCASLIAYCLLFYKQKEAKCICCFWFDTHELRMQWKWFSLRKLEWNRWKCSIEKQIQLQQWWKQIFNCMRIHNFCLWWQIKNVYIESIAVFYWNNC